MGSPPVASSDVIDESDSVDETAPTSGAALQLLAHGHGLVLREARGSLLSVGDEPEDG